MNITDILRGTSVQPGTLMQMMQMMGADQQPNKKVQPSPTKSAFAPAMDDGTTPGILDQIQQMQAAKAQDNIDAGGGWNPALAPAMAADKGDNIDAGGGQNFGMLAGANKGILDSMGGKGEAALMAIGRALAAAGSSDPAKTALGFMAEDRDNRYYNAKVAEMEREKRKPIASGVPGVFLYPKDSGGWETVVDPKALEAAKAMSDSKFTDKALLLLLGKQLETQAAGAKIDQKEAADTRPMLQQSQQMLDSWTKAKEVVSGQAANAPWMSKVQGAVPGLSGFFGGDQVAANKFLQGLTVDETLLNTARTKGAISDKEMELFKSPIPGLSDDREKVWKPFIEQRIPVIQKLMQFQQSQIDRGDTAASRVGSGFTTGSKFTVPGLSEGASKYFSR